MAANKKTSPANPFKGIKATTPKAAAATTKPAAAPHPVRQNFDYVPVIKVDFEPRAGLQTYSRELEERVNDVAEKTGEHAVYEVAVRMKPRVYQALLGCTLRRNRATQTPDWNEQDQVEAWMKLALEEELEKMVHSGQI